MFFIEILGKVKQKNKVADFCENVLLDLMPNVNRTVDIVVKFVTECDDQESGYCYGDNEEVIISIAKNSMGQSYTFDEQMLALCHELVHAKQIITGELNGKLWKGEVIAERSATSTPWEIEAFGLERPLFDKFYKTTFDSAIMFS